MTPVKNENEWQIKIRDFRSPSLSCGVSAARPPFCWTRSRSSNKKGKNISKKKKISPNNSRNWIRWNWGNRSPKQKKRVGLVWQPSWPDKDPVYLASLLVGDAPRRELHSRAGPALHIQLHQPEMEALTPTSSRIKNRTHLFEAIPYRYQTRSAGSGSEIFKIMAIFVL